VFPVQAPRKSLLLAATAIAFSAVPALAEAPRVVASIKPIHALVASVMGDLGTPDLIVEGAASPHAYSLKPSNAAALEAADLVFWTGHGLELFLEDSITTLAPKATIVELAESPGITLLPPREGGAFDGHDHDGDGVPDEEGEEHADEHADHAADAHEDHAHEAEAEAGHDHEAEAHDEHDHEAHDHGEERDMHFFLDPANAAVMVDAIAAALSAADPDDAATYAANATATKADLAALAAELTAKLAPVKARPIVVFHDAYQYFEQRFGLNVAGSITVNPENAPGAARIAEIRAKLGELDTACVFAEPQFDKRVVDVLIEGTSARQGVLDPEGADIEPGPGAYRQLIERLADNLVACLDQ
jgi:zinc transport system substrate-binding protein